MNRTLIIFTAYIVVVLFLSAILIIKTIKKNKNLKEDINELEKEKNLIINAPVLNELSKVEALVKDDKLRYKYDGWQRKFDDIRNSSMPEITDMLIKADTYIDEKRYKELKKLIADIELKIYRSRERTNTLLSEIKEITLSEEKNRGQIVKLKNEYRNIKLTYEKSKEEYKPVNNQIELQFESIEKRFQEFEIVMEKKDYDEINYLVKGISEMIDHIRYVVKEVPTILIMCNELIPNKIADISNTYIKMTRDLYQLDYLNVECNIKETEKKVKNILDRVKVLNLEDVTFELKTIINYYDSLYNDFEYEKSCKNTFESNIKTFKAKLVRTNKIISNLMGQLTDLKSTYDLSEEDVKRLNIINDETKKIKDSYNNLMDCSKNHSFPYSKLVKELDFLMIKVSKLEETLNYDLKTIGSMKDDEIRAREQLDNIKGLLKKAKARIRLYNIPVVPDHYFIELQDASDAIKEIQKELNKKPINIETLNIRVDTARDLVFKVFNTTNSLLKTIAMLEETIVYGNRYKATNKQVNEGLTLAEKLFYKGEYKKALEITMNAIDYVEPGVHKKIMQAYNEN
ncbi:MAG: septation ring formation regulator EzrA [Bacilli bacterium]|nr:septation ring formation regulator EzrA [Bacilli bacterium]MBO6194818.1 septation ring formation regulator EzrA [Bacilli bacterium]